jgi:cyclopropane fatty-acyl-phospholipid synthase-like methyltransferase
MTSYSSPDWPKLTSSVLAVVQGTARWYARARFTVIPPHILDAIDRYLPVNGRIIDLGCGMGLFTALFALAHPECTLLGVDLNSRRISAASEIVRRLGLNNVTFYAEDVRTCALECRPDAVIAVDLLHHIPADNGAELIRQVYELLSPRGRLIIKDIAAHPRGQALFTAVMDQLTSPGRRVCYRDPEELTELLDDIGFVNITAQRLPDRLPYPHVLCTGEKG